MKTNNVRKRVWTWLTLMLLISSLPTMADTQDYKKTKTITQSYSVNKGDRLEVDNRYGNLTITHWNQRQVSVRIEIEGKARSEQDAQAIVDQIKINTIKAGGVIALSTSIEKQRNTPRNASMSIHYYIQMPADLPADLSLRYGNINLPDSKNGKMNINLRYGNLYAGDFNESPDITIKYGDMLVGELPDAKLDLGYAGKVRIKEAGDLTIDAKYSNITVNGEVKSVNLLLKYGSFKAQGVTQLIGDAKYSNLDFGKVEKVLKIGDLGYGNLTVDRLEPSFTEVEVSARYGNCKIGVPVKTAFRVEAEEMKYSDFQVSGFNVTRKEGSRKEAYYRYEVNGGSRPTIHFNGNGYGNLTVRSLP